MSNVLKSIRLDYFTLKATYKTFIGVYVLVIILGVLAKPALIIAVTMIFSAILSGMTFSVYEKNNLSKLYGTLPLRKVEAVIGRYMYALLFGILNELIAGSLANMISLFTRNGMNQIVFISYFSAFFLYFCLAIGISFPIYYKYGFSKSYIFTFLPLYLVFMVGIFMSRKTGALNVLKHMIQYFAAHPYMIWVSGIGAGLILLGISCALSCFINKRNEL